MNPTIRPAADPDIAEVQEIAGRTIKTCFPAFLGQELALGYVDGGLSDAEIVLHRERLSVMVEGDRLVGFCIVVDDLIHLMMIDFALHRLGLGSRMLAWCEAEIRRRGHAVARLEDLHGQQSGGRLLPEERMGRNLARRRRE